MLASLIGSIGTGAVFARAIKLAERDHPQLAGLVVTRDGLDFSPMREALREENPANSRKALVALVDKVFNVLANLPGPSLTPILLEVELELERKASDLKDREAQAKTKGAEEGSARHTGEEKR